MRKLVIAVIGGTVLLLGIAMIVLPGPAVVVILRGWRFWQRNSCGRGAYCKSAKAL